MTTRTSLIGNNTQPIAAGATAVYKGQLQDDLGNPISAASLTTLTLSIVDTVTKAVVNGVSAVNILNTGRGAVDSAGNLTVTLGPADTALLVASDPQEYRSLILDWTFAVGAKTGRHQVDFLIIAMAGS